MVHHEEVHRLTAVATWLSVLVKGGIAEWRPNTNTALSSTIIQDLLVRCAALGKGWQTQRINDWKRTRRVLAAHDESDFITIRTRPHALDRSF